MNHAFSSREALLDPATLSGLLGRRVHTVAVEPMSPKGHSSTGAQFERVRVTTDESADLVIKTVSRGADWVAIATGDEVDREVAVWESGLLDAMPDSVRYPVLACARSASGHCVLMHDLESEFVCDEEPISREWHLGLLRSLASMHAAFWESPALDPSDAVFCPLDRWIPVMAPAAVPTLRERLPDLWVPSFVEEKWRALPTLVGEDLADRLRSLVTEPSPACRALADYPSTVLHGDVRHFNVGWDGRRAALIDWAMPCVGPPGLDLAYYLFMNFEITPVPVEESVDYYLSTLRRSLGGLASSWSWWSRHLDVCLAVVFARMAAVIVDKEANRRAPSTPAYPGIEWWAARAERGLHAIGRM